MVGIAETGRRSRLVLEQESMKRMQAAAAAAKASQAAAEAAEAEESAPAAVDESAVEL
jgi:hypothetical protein